MPDALGHPPGRPAGRQHPSLHAKKYDESTGLWQARANQSWRFYFTIVRGRLRPPHHHREPEVEADLHEPYVVRLARLFGAVAGLYLAAVRPTALPAA